MRSTLIFRSLAAGLLLGLAFDLPAWADPPGTLYIFPAGGQRGTTVKFRVGGLCLHGECPFEMLGGGVKANERIRQGDTVWFEGPVIPQPASQQKEDYPKDYAGEVQIDADAEPGLRAWRVWTSQGAAPSMKFVVGELPEVVENESDSKPAHIPVTLPVTVNGRIFPREEIDVWSFEAKAGTNVNLVVDAARLGSPLDARLEVLDPQGARVAESEPTPAGADPQLSFTATVDGRYQVRIHDLEFEGLQHYVYRLSITTGPRIRWTYPLGGKADAKTAFELGGAGLDGPGGATARAELTLDNPPRELPGDQSRRLSIAGQTTNPVLFEVDRLDEHLESEPANDKPDQPAPLAVPAVFNGRIGARGDVDHWAFEAKKNDEWEIDLRGARLGSPLDGVLSIAGADGKELGRSDDIAGSTDAFLRFKAPADGRYVIRVAEQFGSRGGPAYAYRLRIARPAEEDFELILPSDAITVERGKEVKVKVDVRRRNFDGEIELSATGLPAGVTATGKIPAKQNQTQLSFKAEATAPIASSAIEINGDVKGAKLARQASISQGRGEAPISAVRIAVALPTPFKVVGTFSTVYAPRGAVHVRRYKIERGGYEGPLTVMLADRQGRHLQGVTGPTIAVPPGQTEFDYPVYLPPFMEIGRTSRSNLMAIGEIDEAGAKHKVSYSSNAQNDQIIILVDPGPLSLTADRTSLRAAPGATGEIVVRLERARGLALPVTLELMLPGKQAGVLAEPVVVPADQNQGVLRVRFVEPTPAVKLSALVRGTVMDKGQPVVAELPFEIVPAGR